MLRLVTSYLKFQNDYGKVKKNVFIVLLPTSLTNSTIHNRPLMLVML